MRLIVNDYNERFQADSFIIKENDTFYIFSTGVEWVRCFKSTQLLGEYQYVDNEEENLPKALKRVVEIDPTCYCRVHGGGFAGTILMIVNKSKINDIRPILIKEFKEENVMGVTLTEFGTTRL